MPLKKNKKMFKDLTSISSNDIIYLTSSKFPDSHAIFNNDSKILFTKYYEYLF